jgi:hypothetical protein
MSDPGPGPVRRGAGVQPLPDSRPLVGFAMADHLARLGAGEMVARRCAGCDDPLLPEESRFCETCQDSRDNYFLEFRDDGCLD